MEKTTIEFLLNKVLTDQVAPGDQRARKLINRITEDLFATITELQVTPDEFWAAAKWLEQLGQSGQVGLITAGLGLDRLIDVLEDDRDQRNGLPQGTPRAIEGPLFVPGAPSSDHEARLNEPGDAGEPMVMEGVILSADGKPIPGALIDVWHANDKGRYSHFDPDQKDYHLRRKIVADAQGRYRFGSVIPPGYAIPPNSPTSQLFALLGRHGNRPAHVHFLVSAPGHRALTTQINLPGDPYLDDDFAYATRQELVVTLEDASAAQAAEYATLGITSAFKRIRFDFSLQPSLHAEDAQHLGRNERVAPH